MTKKLTHLNSKTLTTLFGCVVVLCALIQSDVHADEIEIKTSQFDEILDDIDAEIGGNNDSQLAEKIRKQRAAFNAQSAKNSVATSTKAAMASGKNECDQKLRACMKSKCGDDYSKCAGDTDTMWGSKMDTCRLDITCTGEEYRLFTTEIKADRDMNARLASYTSIINCGNEYNDCIISECGKTFTNCLGKTAGDKAIQKCSKIATKCKQQDSGLASRAMESFGNLRGNAEKAIVRDEKRLYELRDTMRETCSRLGAMFDERSLDCVYTVNFYAGGDGDLYASKKAYAGSTFNCTQEWFGVDITTFMENAFRLTRAQSSASSAAFGAGVGMAAGAITSGAIDRAIDRAKAERALGQELCESTHGKWNKGTNSCNCPKQTKFDKENGCLDKDGNPATESDADAKATKKQERKDEQALKKLCKDTDGNWIIKNKTCKCKSGTFDEDNGCPKPESDPNTENTVQPQETSLKTLEDIDMSTILKYAQACEIAEKQVTCIRNDSNTGEILAKSDKITTLNEGLKLKNEIKDVLKKCKIKIQQRTCIMNTIKQNLGLDLQGILDYQDENQ